MFGAKGRKKMSEKDLKQSRRQDRQQMIDARAASKAEKNRHKEAMQSKAIANAKERQKTVRAGAYSAAATSSTANVLTGMANGGFGGGRSNTTEEDEQKQNGNPIPQGGSGSNVPTNW